MGQLAQREELPLRVLKTNGAYPDAVDLASRRCYRGRRNIFA